MVIKMAVKTSEIAMIIRVCDGVSRAKKNEVMDGTMHHGGPSRTNPVQRPTAKFA